MSLSRRGLIALISSAAGIKPASSQNAADLGILTPFYRATQLQGHLLGMGLIEIPDYLLGQDIGFRYKKRTGGGLEIPFVDSFAINRFLGGYREDWLKKFHLWDQRLGRGSLDYVVRSGDGSLQFRPELIKMRLQPYLEAGYRPKDITVALENVPWALVNSSAPAPNEGPWGQNRPPSDLRQWADVIRRFAEDLKAYLGPAAAEIGFKTGVEYDEKASFDAPPDAFRAYYGATDAALHAVLPGASLCPGEFTGLGVCDETPAASCSYDTRRFLDFAEQHHLTVSYVPRSLHSLLSTPNPMPSAAVQRAASSYARLPNVVREIHQFGLLFQQFGTGFGSDPAALQANWEFQTLIRLWETVKPRRVFHWGGFVQVAPHSLLNGSGFLRLLLDQYLGYRAVRLAAARPNGAAAQPEELLAVGFSKPPSSAVLLSSFSPKASSGAPVATVAVPPALLGGNAPLRTIRYRQSDNVFTLIRSDLASEGNLKPEFRSHALCVSDPVDMAIDADRARRLVAQNWARYVEKIKEGLRWRSDDSAVLLDGGVLRAGMEANELLVVQRAPQ